MFPPTPHDVVLGEPATGHTLRLPLFALRELRRQWPQLTINTKVEYTPYSVVAVPQVQATEALWTAKYQWIVPRRRSPFRTFACWFWRTMGTLFKRPDWWQRGMVREYELPKVAAFNVDAVHLQRFVFGRTAFDVGYHTPSDTLYVRR